MIARSEQINRSEIALLLEKRGEEDVGMVLPGCELRQHTKASQQGLGLACLFVPCPSTVRFKLSPVGMNVRPERGRLILLAEGTCNANRHKSGAAYGTTDHVAPIMSILMHPIRFVCSCTILQS